MLAGNLKLEEGLLHTIVFEISYPMKCVDQIISQNETKNDQNISNKCDVLLSVAWYCRKFCRDGSQTRHIFPNMLDPCDQSLSLPPDLMQAQI